MIAVPFIGKTWPSCGRWEQPTYRGVPWTFYASAEDAAVVLALHGYEPRWQVLPLPNCATCQEAQNEIERSGVNGWTFWEPPFRPLRELL